MFEFRTDVATLRPARRLDDGRLVTEALITKPGVFEYADASYPGGIRRELRPDAEVYSKATMDSFASMPATPGHPPMLLTSATAKQFMVGATGESVAREPVAGDADWVKTGLMVADKATIQKMDAGDNAVSVGYACRIDETSGVDPKYGRYDLIQRDIRGNHLAVAIPAGRAGRLARARMDTELTPEERGTLASGKFAYPEESKLPIENADHVRAAMARFGQTDFSKNPSAKAKAAARIIAAAKKFSIDASGFAKANRADDMMMGDDVTLTVMTTATDGHQHTLDPSCSSGVTSYAASEKAEDAQDTHRHEWIRTADGKITIAENTGHAHEVDPSTIGMRGDALAAADSSANLARARALASTFGGSSGGDHARLDSVNHVGGAMDPEKMKETARLLEAGLKEAETSASQHKARADAAETERDIALGKIGQLEKEIGTLSAQISAGAQAVETAAVMRERERADSLDAKVSRFDETFRDKVRERTTLMFQAGSILGSDFRMDDLSERAIKCAVLKRADSTADVGDGVPDGVITGQFMEVLKRAMKRARQDVEAASIMTTTTEKTREDSKEQKLQDYRDQWKRPLSTPRKGA